MKLFSAEQIRRCDNFTIRNTGITSLQLMENAAQACVAWIIGNYDNAENFQIYCGPGNNGGDGLAIARLLFNKGYTVNVFLDLHGEGRTEDSNKNLKTLQQLAGIGINDISAFREFGSSKNAILIDALFGTGLNRKPDGIYAEVIQHLNESENPTVAIDIPSGLAADNMVENGSAVVRADHTLTFQFRKKSFLHPETGFFCGKVHVLDIGLSEDFINMEPVSDYVIDEILIRELYRPRRRFSHKGNYGKTIVVAGSYGKIGAAVLAVGGALKSGSGITYAAAPKCGYEILQTACPEAMFQAAGDEMISEIPQNSEAVFGIGPGIGTHPETVAALELFLKDFRKPLVLDADALNILAGRPDLLKALPAHSIITPHPKEFERLFGKTDDSFQRVLLAKQKTEDLQICIVLKDHHTQVVTPDGKVFYNTSGNSGMAKGGSGDVLLGIITSLIAQQYPPEDAAVLGVWLHGKAGDLAAKKHSKEAMVATDLISEIGNVFLMLSEGV